MALTHYESIVLLVLIGFALVGSGVRLVHDQLMPIPEPSLPADHATFVTAAAELNATFTAPSDIETVTADDAAAAAPVAEAPQAKPKARKAPAPSGSVNVNTGSLAELDRLPGVGPAIAQRIIDYREAHGAFASVSALQRVRGIGPKTLAKFEAMAVVE
ncbi:MAG: hypothetical protein RhofKO_07130 [Rhodothermales bacterium]